MSSPVATHFPASLPQRDSPNAHPYAIKTSSSAVLTRSNSSGQRNSTSHHYSPLSPSKSTAANQSRYVPSHRHTSSMSSANEDIFAKPPPVPLPPSPSVLVGMANGTFNEGIVSDGEGIPPTPPITWRLKRSETLPSIFHSKSDSDISAEDLPKNPKIWTPSQLSVYLSNSLRLKGDVKPPVPVMRDIAVFVVKERLSGRAFLRMKKSDYDKFGINQLWKDALHDASRALRQSIVQGRIMGFSSPPEEMIEQDEDDIPSVKLPDLPAYSTLDPTRRRFPKQWEEDQKHMSKVSFRAGRVRGMVETYERSVSGSSDIEDEDEEKVVEVAKFGKELVDEPQPADAGFASGELTSGSEDDAIHPTDGVTEAPPTASSGDPFATLPAPSFGSEMPGKVIEDDSPSIEALLREQEANGDQGKQYQSWGAKAWEDELELPDGVHVTAKRVPPGVHGTTRNIPLAQWKNTMPHPGTDNPRSSLAGIFEQPVDDVPSAAEAPQDGSVGVAQETGEQQADLSVFATLEAFQRRLADVERRLEELERKDMERANVANAARSRKEQEPEPATAFTLSVPRPFDLLFPADRKPKEKHVANYNETDPSVTALPRYMFLLSLGVAAIVTRVVLRQVFGDKRRK